MAYLAIRITLLLLLLLRTVDVTTKRLPTEICCLLVVCFICSRKWVNSLRLSAYHLAAVSNIRMCDVDFNI